MILVDTNVILDLVEDDPVWADWSQQQLEIASLQDSVCINAVIYAELSIAFETIEELEAALTRGKFSMEAIPREALFLAGKVFLQYRKRKGIKQSVLPDFFIGAHAAVQGMKLLTRDKGHYTTYFPTVQLIGPPT